MITQTSSEPWGFVSPNAEAAKIHAFALVLYSGFFALALLSPLMAADLPVPTSLLAVLGLSIAIHAALRAGAIRRLALARWGSIFLGILYLFGFPLFTVYGVFLLRKAVPSWGPIAT